MKNIILTTGLCLMVSFLSYGYVHAAKTGTKAPGEDCVGWADCASGCCVGIAGDEGSGQCCVSSSCLASPKLKK